KASHRINHARRSARTASGDRAARRSAGAATTLGLALAATPDARSRVSLAVTRLAISRTLQSETQCKQLVAVSRQVARQAPARCARWRAGTQVDPASERGLQDRR